MKRTRKICLCLSLALASGLLTLCLVQSAAAVSYQRGSSGSVVRQIQTKLKDWGYYTGSVDGVFGSATEKAVIKFQKIIYSWLDSGLTNSLQIYQWKKFIMWILKLIQKII